jgi:hypothetical protein
MNQADKDAQKWMEENEKRQRRKLIEAKERGFIHYINPQGDVVVLPEKAKDES